MGDLEEAGRVLAAKFTVLFPAPGRAAASAADGRRGPQSGADDRGRGPVTRHRVAASVFAPDPGQGGPFTPPTPAQMSSFHRAVRSLARKGLFRKAGWTGVLKVTPSGRQALDDLRYTSKNADLDRKVVCRGRKRLRPRTPAPARRPLRS
jgi:hypothetical protein